MPGSVYSSLCTLIEATQEKYNTGQGFLSVARFCYIFSHELQGLVWWDISQFARGNYSKPHQQNLATNQKPHCVVLDGWGCVLGWNLHCWHLVPFGPEYYLKQYDFFQILIFYALPGILSRQIWREKYNFLHLPAYSEKNIIILTGVSLVSLNNYITRYHTYRTNIAFWDCWWQN